MAALDDSRITEIIQRHRPHGVELRWKQRHYYSVNRVLGVQTPFRPAHACDRRNEIYCADPRRFEDESDRRRALAIFLHECGHFRAGKGHFRAQLFRHVEEYEAERWGQGMMRLEGIAVPRAELRAAKVYVRDCIKEDEVRGIKIASHIRRWSAR